MEATLIKSQQEIMREIIEAGMGRHDSAMAWVVAVKDGRAKRNSNVNKVSEYEYGLLLLDDVMRRITGKPVRPIRRAKVRK
jgi:hypothetical protein